MKKMATIELGYVGLPLAALFAKNDYSVVGLESNEAVVARLKAHECHIKDEAVVRYCFVRLLQQGTFCQPVT